MSKGPSGDVPGDGISAEMVRQPPPLCEAPAAGSEAVPTLETRLPASDHLGGTCHRLGTKVLSHDR